MSSIVSSIKLCNIPISKQFIHEQFSIISNYNRIKLDLQKAIENKLYFIEYIIVVFDNSPIKSKIKLVCNGFDMTECMDFIYYNKIYPLHCEKLYDNDENKLLEYMIKNNTNIAFIPIRAEKNATLLDITPQDYNFIPSRQIESIYLTIYNYDHNNNNHYNIDVYMKLSDSNTKNIDKFNYSHI